MQKQERKFIMFKRLLMILTMSQIAQNKEDQDISKSGIQLPPLLVGIIPIILAVINLHLLSQAKDEAQLGLSALFFFAVGSMIWDKRKSLSLYTDKISIVLGILMIVGMLSQSFDVEPTKTISIYRIFPFLIAIASGLIASGFKGLKQYKIEIMILFFLGIPSYILVYANQYGIMHLGALTAPSSAFMLTYIGYEVELVEKVYIYLPGGAVHVDWSCAGADLICYMLAMGVLTVSMFPIRKKYNLPVISFAVFLAFIVNSMRVALMAILVAAGEDEAFKFMHEGNGSLVFGVICVCLFGGSYWLLMNYEDKRKQDKLDSSPDNNLSPLQKDSFF